MRILLYILLTLVSSVATARTIHEVPNVHVAQATRWVSDPDGLLSPSALSRADALLDSLNSSTTTEVAVAIVADMSGADVDIYATELFELWGIGKKDRDNGLLLVISRDDRRAAIRTGYGMEGVINDGRAGRIIRTQIAPNMKEGDIDGALLGAVAAISEYVKDPEAADYLYSNQSSKGSDDEEDFKNFLRTFGIFALIITIAAILWILISWFSSRNLSDQQRYARLDGIKVPVLVIIPLTLGMGILSWLLLWALMRYIRLRRHNCPNCGCRMHRVDEVHDNDYLTPAQDMEEKINSVDYDVWLCPQCNETDIIPYVNKRSTFTICPNCGARADALTANRILRQPTTRSEGQGVRMYRCRNCGNVHSVPYAIAKVVEPPIIITGGGGGRGFGGGGFSGGSFGGGMTGGGGASGGW